MTNEPDEHKSEGGAPPPEGGAPRTRRRMLADAPAPTAMPAAPAATGDASAAAGEIARARHAATEADAAEPASKPATPADGEALTPGRRVMRFVLMALVVLAAWACLMLIIKNRMRNRNAGMAAEQMAGPPAVDREDEGPGNAEALALEGRIAKGEHAAVVAEAAAIRAKFGRNEKVLSALFKAETVVAVQATGATLDKLPLPQAEDPKVSVEDNLRTLRERIGPLALLAAHRRDWGESLTSLDAARPLYAKYDKEIAAAPNEARDWEIGRVALDRAKAALETFPPAFDLARSQLKLAQGRLPLAIVPILAENAGRIAAAEKMIGKRDLEGAVKNLDAMRFDDGAAPAANAETPAPEAPKAPAAARPTRVFEIQALLKTRFDAAQAKLGAWRELHKVDTDSLAAHKAGKTVEALEAIRKALPLADSKNPLTVEMVRLLNDRATHYAAVQEKWTAALAIRDGKPLKDQLQAWAQFQPLLDKDDAYYKTATTGELKKIKGEIQASIAKNHAALAGLGTAYKGISTKMRRPEEPRAPFAEQAKALAAMAAVADQTRALAALVPTWRFGEETELQVDNARRILSDHNEQAQKLWNLGQLYRQRGKLDWAKECFERVVLLGEGSSNPWYPEAKKLAQGNP